MARKSTDSREFRKAKKTNAPVKSPRLCIHQKHNKESTQQKHIMQNITFEKHEIKTHNHLQH
jgi:hypothetical protein